jgi:hypothetical protein
MRKRFDPLYSRLIPIKNNTLLVSSRVFAMEPSHQGLKCLISSSREGATIPLSTFRGNHHSEKRDPLPNL